MTPAEFAESHGLSLEEATYILSRRRQLAEVSLGAEGRLERARLALSKAQKKVGVAPVVEGYADDLVKVEDPEAEMGLETFYASKGGNFRKSEILPTEDYSQESGDE